MKLLKWLESERWADLVQALREELAGERAARAFAMQRMAELKLEHARIAEEYRRRLAVSQANFEWLTVSYNQIQAERAALLSEKIGLRAQPMQVSNVLVETGGRPREDPRDPAEQSVDGTLADFVANGSIFDDLGTQKARALGLDTEEVYDPMKMGLM